MNKTIATALVIASLMLLAYIFFPPKPADGKCMSWLVEKDGSKTCVMKDAPRLK